MKLLLDTNIVLFYLSGDERLKQLLDGLEIHLSFITVVELLSYPSLSEAEEKRIRVFLNDCFVVGESPEIRDETIKIRKEYKLKLPDAFIAATSLLLKIPLISADKDFSKLEKLSFIDFEV